MACSDKSRGSLYGASIFPASIDRIDEGSFPVRHAFAFVRPSVRPSPSPPPTPTPVEFEFARVLNFDSRIFAVVYRTAGIRLRSPRSIPTCLTWRGATYLKSSFARREKNKRANSLRAERKG